MPPPAGGCAVPAVHGQPWRSQTSLQHPLLTTHSSSGWPVASLHAPLAFSRTPSRSAPATASPSGRSDTGPSLVRDERSRPSPLPTSEHGLSLGRVTVLPAEHLHLQRVGREALLAQSQENSGTGCGVAVMAPWQIKVLFSYRTLAFVRVPTTSLYGLGEHSSPTCLLPLRTTS